MIERSFEPGARITIQHRDMRQACELGRDLYAQLIERGEGDLDRSALIRLLRDEDA